MTDIGVKRVQPKDGLYDTLGEMVVGWAMGTLAMPELDEAGAVKDLAAFRDSVKHLVDIPEHIERVIFVSPETIGVDKAEYYIRLPFRPLVEASVERVKAVDQALATGNPVGMETDYKVPHFYAEFLSDSQAFGHEKMLYSRIADYTFAHCK